MEGLTTLTWFVSRREEGMASLMTPYAYFYSNLSPLVNQRHGSNDYQPSQYEKGESLTQPRTIFDTLGITEWASQCYIPLPNEG